MLMLSANWVFGAWTGRKSGLFGWCKRISTEQIYFVGRPESDLSIVSATHLHSYHKKYSVLNAQNYVIFSMVIFSAQLGSYLHNLSDNGSY